MKGFTLLTVDSCQASEVSGCSTVWHRFFFFFFFVIVRCRSRNSPGFLTISVDAKLGTGLRVKRSHGSQQDGWAKNNLRNQKAKISSRLSRRVWRCQTDFWNPPRIEIQMRDDPVSNVRLCFQSKTSGGGSRPACRRRLEKCRRHVRVKPDASDSRYCVFLIGYDHQNFGGRYCGVDIHQSTFMFVLFSMKKVNNISTLIKCDWCITFFGPSFFTLSNFSHFCLKTTNKINVRRSKKKHSAHHLPFGSDTETKQSQKFSSGHDFLSLMAAHQTHRCAAHKRRHYRPKLIYYHPCKHSPHSL